MSNPDKQKWDACYASSTEHVLLPCEFLLDYQHLLPEQGSALDLACGRGGNAIFLAEHGLNVEAWDISSKAIELLNQSAQDRKLSINVQARDVVANPPEADSFDIIVVSRFLDRTLIPKIRAAIKSGGLIFYQTFIQDKINDKGPSNPEYLLDKNELLSFFNDWRILLYHEEGSVGNIEQGFRNQAMLIAQKP